MSSAIQPADLGFFSALAGAGSLSAAARELGVSTPAVSKHLAAMEAEGQLRVRMLAESADSPAEPCYYAKSLYYEEEYVARRLAMAAGRRGLDPARIAS